MRYIKNASEDALLKSKLQRIAADGLELIISFIRSLPPVMAVAGAVQHVESVKTSVCVLIFFPFIAFGKTLNFQKQAVFYSLLLLVFIPERIYPADRSFHKGT